MRRLVAAAAGLGLALLPGPALAACTTPELPVAGCVVPAATPSPTPASTTTTAPTTAPTAVPASVPAAAPAATPEPALLPVQVATVPALSPAVPTSPAVPAPVLGAPATAQAVALPAAARQPAAAPFVPLSGVVASSFALVAFGLLALALLLSFLAGLRPAPAPPGGTMNRRRTRLWTGLGVLAAAAVVGGVGWYRLSGEPLLNRQIPFLASAGILVVLLSVLGGSLIIAEQLRGDQDRIGELEDAVRALTEALSPLVEQPPRTAQEEELSPQPGRARSRAGAAGRT
jgi:hypothetical protein